MVEIPGHTHGSVAFLDRAHRLLIPGDSVAARRPHLPVWGTPGHLFIHRKLGEAPRAGRRSGHHPPLPPQLPHWGQSGSPKTWKTPKPWWKESSLGKKQEQMPCYLTKANGPPSLGKLRKHTATNGNALSQTGRGALFYWVFSRDTVLSSPDFQGKMGTQVTCSAGSKRRPE